MGCPCSSPCSSRLLDVQNYFNSFRTITYNGKFSKCHRLPSFHRVVCLRYRDIHWERFWHSFSARCASRREDSHIAQTDSGTRTSLMSSHFCSISTIFQYPLLAADETAGGYFRSQTEGEREKKYCISAPFNNTTLYT